MGQNFQPPAKQLKKLRALKDELRFLSQSSVTKQTNEKIDRIRSDIASLVYQFRGLYKKEPESGELHSVGKLRMPRSRSSVTGKAASLVMNWEEDGVGRPVIPT